MEHFFRCTECSQHFGAMAAEEGAAGVATARAALIWSWRAHNIVRAPPRLLGASLLYAHSHSPTRTALVWYWRAFSIMRMPWKSILLGGDRVPNLRPTSHLLPDWCQVPVCPQVNQRVAKEELTDLSGDPFFPKVGFCSRACSVNKRSGIAHRDVHAAVDVECCCSSSSLGAWCCAQPSIRQQLQQRL